MAEINDIVENEDDENLGIDDVEELVNPEVPDTIDNQQLTVYVPLATGNTPGISKYDSAHFIVENGNVKLRNSTVDLPLEKGAGKNSFQQTNNIASGENSTALGMCTRATALAAFSAGIGTRASVSGQAVFGTYNEERSDALFIIGNGDNANGKSNAFEVLKDGTLNYKGKYKVATGDVLAVLSNSNQAITIVLDFEPNLLVVSGKDNTNVLASVLWSNGRVCFANEGVRGDAPFSNNKVTINFAGNMSGMYTFTAIGGVAGIDSSGGGMTPDIPDIPEEDDGKEITFYIDYGFMGGATRAFTVANSTTWSEFVPDYFEIDEGMGNSIYNALDGFFLTKINGRTQTADMVIEDGATYYGSPTFVSEEVSLVNFTITSEIADYSIQYTVAAGTTWAEWCATTWSEEDEMYEWQSQGSVIENMMHGGILADLSDGYPMEIAGDAVIVEGEYYHIM